MSRQAFREGCRRGLPPAFVCALLWFVLTAGEPSSWLIGAPVVIACAAAVAVLVPRARVRISPWAVARFLPFFVWRSLAGGLDVAHRALGRTLAIAPDLVTYRLRLPGDGPARVVFVNVLSLLPGTLAADLDGQTVRVHTLGPLRHANSLQRLEAHVAGLFGHHLPEDGDGV
jgi:multicomponent Na+:H+ antiporter subunit E